MQRCPFSIFFDRANGLLDVIDPKVFKNWVHVAMRDQLQKLLLIVNLGSKAIFVNPVHLEFTPLQFLLGFREIGGVPVFFCVFREVHREAWIDHGAGQLLRSQSIESLFHELINDMFIRL